MGGFIFVLIVFIFRSGSPAGRAVTGVLYGLAFIPMTYWTDRFAYRMYQRRLAKASGEQPKKASRPAKS